MTEALVPGLISLVIVYFLPKKINRILPSPLVGARTKVMSMLNTQCVLRKLVGDHVFHKRMDAFENAAIVPGAKISDFND